MNPTTTSTLSRIFLRRHSQWVVAQSGRLSKVASLQHPKAPCAVHFRSLVAAAQQQQQQTPKAVCYEDLVKQTLKKMIAERDDADDEATRHAIANEDLERSFRYFESKFKEAELCIADLEEATMEEKEAEGECARTAVDNAFRAYLDWLEDLRMASAEQLTMYQDARVEHVTNLKKLRQELAKILDVDK